MEKSRENPGIKNLRRGVTKSTGRTPNQVRDQMRHGLVHGLQFAYDLASGKIKGASNKDRLDALKFLAQYGLGLPPQEMPEGVTERRVILDMSALVPTTESPGAS